MIMRALHDRAAHWLLQTVYMCMNFRVGEERGAPGAVDQHGFPALRRGAPGGDPRGPGRGCFQRGVPGTGLPPDRGAGERNKEACHPVCPRVVLDGESDTWCRNPGALTWREDTRELGNDKVRVHPFLSCDREVP